MKRKIMAIVIVAIAIIGISQIVAYTYPDDVLNVYFSGHDGSFRYFCDFNKGWEAFSIEGFGNFSGFIDMNIGDFSYDHNAPHYLIECGWDEQGGWFEDANGYTGLYYGMEGIQDIFLSSDGKAGYFTDKEYYYGGTNVGNKFNIYTDCEYTGHIYNFRQYPDYTISMAEMFNFEGTGEMNIGGTLRLGGVPGDHSSYMNMSGEFNGEGNFDLYQYEFSANWGIPWSSGKGQINADEFHNFSWNFDTGEIDIEFNWEDDEIVNWWFELYNQ